MGRTGPRVDSLPMFAAIGRPRLSLIMSLLFIGLSIPGLIFIHLSAPRIYGWFTEGFSTRDLKDAKALLDALRA
jgi:hypothetical protein